jgi:hypothetical protein
VELAIELEAGLGGDDILAVEALEEGLPSVSDDKLAGEEMVTSRWRGFLEAESRREDLRRSDFSGVCMTTGSGTGVF